MKQINKGELYEHLGGFLKARGIELKEGSYSQRIEQGCGLLSEAINLGQKGIARAKTEVDEKLEQMRQVIHEKTAPKPAAAPPPPAGTSGQPRARSGASAKEKMSGKASARRRQSGR